MNGTPANDNSDNDRAKLMQMFSAYEKLAHIANRVVRGDDICKKWAAREMKKADDLFFMASDGVDFMD